MKINHYHSILLLFFGIVLASCSAALESEADKKIKENDTTIQNYLKNANIQAQKTASGLYYAIKPSGKTQKPKFGEEVGIYYVMSRTDGQIIDSTATLQQKPDLFPYGIGYKLAGIEEGLSLMNVGDKATLLIPSALAFGDNAFDVLPAYSVIRIDLELVSSKTEEQQINDHIAKNKLKVGETTASGLRFIPVSYAAGGGTALKTGQIAIVNYTGSLLRDIRTVTAGKYTYASKFESGTFSFAIGGGASIAGFEEGISKMKIGDKAILVFPSSLGYKEKGSGNIPPYSPLQFEVEVTGVK